MQNKTELRNILERMENLYAAVDAWTASMRTQVNAPCEKECTHCCHQLVTASIPEALIAMRRVPTSFNKEIPRLEREIMLLSQPDASNRKWFMMNIPCVFLKERLCSIYPDRPVACRTQLSGESSPDKCMNVGHVQRLKLVDSRAMLEKAINEARRVNQYTGIPWGSYPFQVSLLYAWEIIMSGLDKFVQRMGNKTFEQEIETMLFWAQLEVRP